MPPLPDGGRTRWIVDKVHEVVCYATFDPQQIRPALPAKFRFVTVSEVAKGGASWARDYLKEHASHSQWGISFLEIVQAKEFSIDGKKPHFPQNGAVALWCARIAPVGEQSVYARPFLLLNMWIPDAEYAIYMRQRGHYATFGDVRLTSCPDGSWLGSVQTADLHISMECKPQGPISGGDHAAGTQTLIPPATASMPHFVQVVFAEHREQECLDANWRITGPHPLGSSRRACSLKFSVWISS